MKTALSIVCLLMYSFTFSQQALPFKKGNKWGFVNAKKEWLVQPVYDSISVEEGFFLTHLFMGTVGARNVYVDGVYSADGQHITDTVNLGIYGTPADGFFVGNKMVYQVIYDWKGKKIREIPSGSGFSSVMAGHIQMRGDDGFEYLADLTLKRVTPRYADMDLTDYDGLVRVQSAEEQLGIFDTKLKKEIVPLVYDELETDATTGGFIGIQNDQQVLLDRNGKELYRAPAGYAYIGYHTWRSKTAEGSYALYAAGKVIQGKAYDDMEKFNDGFLLASRNKQLFVLDKTLQEIPVKLQLPDNYLLGTFYDGFAYVRSGGDVYFIDTKGTVALKFLKNRTSVLGGFENGFCTLEDGTIEEGFRFGVINTKGAWVLKPVYKDIRIRPFKNTVLFAVETIDGQHFYVDVNGNELLEK